MDGTAAVGVASKYAREDHVHPTDTSRASVTYVNSQIATVAPVTYVDAQDATKAPLASPALTGTPTAPTPTAGDNSTKIATTAFVAAAVVAPAYPPGHIYGLTLSNNVGTPNTQVDIASGAARDIGDTQNLKLTSGLTKSLGSVWAAGSGSGGLDTGTTANSTSYFVFLIGTTAGVIDALFSTSPTSPVMPSGYTTKRRIGSVTTDSAGNIKLFYQVPGTGEVHWRSTSAPRDVNNVSVTGLTATLFSVSTPIGIKVRGIFLFNTGSGTGACSISDPDAGPPPDNTYSQASAGNFDEVVSWTSTASKVYVTTGATGTVNVWTKGWYDYRDAAF
jgi:hypothetical protein